MVTPKNPIQVAVIGAAHGIRGEVRVKAFTGDPTALAAYGTLYTEDGRALTATEARPSGPVVVLRFKEVSDRNAAEALNGIALFIDRSVLPADLDEDEYYHADLIGLPVFDETGEKIGRIVAIHDFGAGDMLEISLPSGRTAMTPFTKAAVPEIDFAEGIVRIDSVAAGLDDAETTVVEGDGFDVESRPRGPRSAGGNR